MVSFEKQSTEDTSKNIRGIMGIYKRRMDWYQQRRSDGPLCQHPG